MKFTYMLIGLLITSLTWASPYISGIMYNPQGSDSGKEWVELHNPSNTSLRDTCSLLFGNGANANDWSEQWSGQVSIAPQSYFLIGEPEVLPQPDALGSLSLQNGPDALFLNCTGHQDLVGWGDHQFDEYYAGEPAQTVGDGIALNRINFSGNNLHDFASSNLNPRNSRPPQFAIIDIALSLQPIPTLHALTNCTDDLDLEGIQLLPNLLESTPLSCTIDAEHIDTLSIELINSDQDVLYTTTSDADRFTLYLDKDLPAGEYMVRLSHGATELVSFPLTYLASKGVDISPPRLAWTNLSLNTVSEERTINIRNTGNTPVNITLISSFASVAFIVDGGRNFTDQYDHAQAIDPFSTHQLTIAPYLLDAKELNGTIRVDIR